MMSTKELEVLEKIKDHAKSTRRNRDYSDREYKPGEGIRQGDVYLFFIRDVSRQEQHKELTELFQPDSQSWLTSSDPGSTKDHIIKVPEHGDIKAITLHRTYRMPLELEEHVRFMQGNIPLLGPTVRAREPFVLTHKKHDNFTLPAGMWQLVFQLDPRTRRRVID